MGLASRREADKLVENGHVLLNGNPVKSGDMVKEKDNVEVEGFNKQYQYFAYYKPRGIPTQDLPGKKSVITEWKNKGLYPIGRLDKDSEGLLILTNDGRFATEVLSHDSKYEKEYIATVKEPLRPGIVQIFKKGMDTKDFGKLLPAKAQILSKTRLKIILNEGKKHQIRVMLNDLSYTITSLKRVRIGNIEIGNMKPGETRPLDIVF